MERDFDLYFKRGIKMKCALYSGSFDPITKGHKDIIRRASKMCDRLIVAVLNNSSKNYLFSLEEREEMLKKSLKEFKNIEIISFDGLLVELMKKIECRYIIRGLRAVADYEYELALAYGNYEISDEQVETIFIPASKKYLYLSSSMVREIAKYEGKLSNYLEDYIADRLKAKIKGR